VFQLALSKLFLRTTKFPMNGRVFAKQMLHGLKASEVTILWD
jgi:hypothetical protein